MPHKCAVATCRGNYKNGPKVAVFKFPNETELRMKWIRSLRRKDGFQPTKHTRVCELHFRSDEIIREIEMYDEKSAKLIKAPISRPRLKKDAYLLSSLMAHPTCHQILYRECHQKRRKLV
ncbi:uncharacterized protein LOC118186361 [Stegodyphus dumicola]|uniref:uncharacterized protein LOC118186361 n=1 Tax=Stegodyphus dumicola TaxID=202533 RepID=UPI0015A8BC60|nr:uncharacterized protein LOC118186361 [Stegodyphus dumicola]